MKNKRNVIIAFILICCLCLSIGYAALTDTLYVTGKADVNVLSDDDDPKETTPFEKDLMENVYWSAATATENTVTVSRGTEANSGITGASDTTDSDSKPDVVSIDIPAGVLTSEGDSTTVTATVKNESDYDISATLNAVTVDSAYSQYFTVTWAWANNGAGAINQNGTADVTITITLTKAPINDITNAGINMTLTATATG